MACRSIWQRSLHMSLLRTSPCLNMLLRLQNSLVLTQERVECVLCAEHGSGLLFLMVDEGDEVVD